MSINRKSLHLSYDSAKYHVPSTDQAFPSSIERKQYRRLRKAQTRRNIWDKHRSELSLSVSCLVKPYDPLVPILSLATASILPLYVLMHHSCVFRLGAYEPQHGHSEIRWQHPCAIGSGLQGVRVLVCLTPAEAIWKLALLLPMMVQTAGPVRIICDILEVWRSPPIQRYRKSRTHISKETWSEEIRGGVVKISRGLIRDQISDDWVYELMVNRLPMIDGWMMYDLSRLTPTNVSCSSESCCTTGSPDCMHRVSALSEDSVSCDGSRAGVAKIGVLIRVATAKATSLNFMIRGWSFLGGRSRVERSNTLVKGPFANVWAPVQRKNKLLAVPQRS